MKRLSGFILATVLFCTVCFFGAVGCSGNEKTKIVFACNSGYYLDFQKRIAEFSKINPDIEVEIRGISANTWGEMLNTVAGDIANGIGPDVADIASEGMHAFAQAGLLEPLDAYIERDKDELKETLDNIDPLILNAHKISGTTYSLPTVWNNMCMYYNKKVLAAAGLEAPKAGWTINEFLAMAKKVAEKNTGGSKDVYGFHYYNAYFMTMAPWMLAFDAQILNDDWTKSALNTQAAKDAFKFLYDMVKTSKIAPSVTDSGIELFAQDRLAFMGCGMWYVQSLANYDMDINDYDVVPFPSIDGSLRSIVGVGGAPVFSTSTDKEAAWKLSKFLSSKNFQEEYLTESIWAIPAVKTAADIIAAGDKTPANAKIFYDSASYGTYVPAPAKYQEIESVLLSEFGAYLAGARDLNTAIERVDRRINEALAG